MLEIPNVIKIPFFLMENIFSQLVDQFLKFEEIDLIHYVKDTVIQIENTLINVRLRVSKIS